jgi:hypothetical protein
MNRRRYTARNIDGLRLVSKPNGLWAVERRIGPGNRERDPWVGLHRPTDLETAKAQFHAAAHTRNAKVELEQ